MNDLPSVTVLIPTFNRIADLAVSMARAAEIDYPNLRVLVVDDGSTNGAEVETVVRESGADYLRTPRNMGLIAARNYGLAACSSRYVVNLDDDSWFKESVGLRSAVEFLEAHPGVAVLALNVETKSGIDWPEADVPVVVPYYTGCGNIYRRQDVVACGPYIEEFVRQGEEAERSLRLMSDGKLVVAVPGIGVYHAHSPVNRSSTRAVSYEAVNYLRREVLRAPLWLILLGLCRAAVFTLSRWSLIDKAIYKSEMLGSRNLMSLAQKYRRSVPTRRYLAWQVMAWRYHRRHGDVGSYVRRYSFDRRP
jgi:glycosyltransferase involved in cell wall biosynthesis